MLDIEPARRHKADFFIELYAVRNDREVNKFAWFDKAKFTDAMLRKAEAGGLKSVTDFRIVKQHINNAVKAGKISALSRKLEEFADNPTFTPDHLNIQSAEVNANARKILKSTSTLYDLVDSIDIDEYFGEKELWEKLNSLSKLINAKLKKMSWRE